MHSELCIVCASDIFGILNVNNVFRPINENESAKPVMQIMKLLKLAGDALFEVVSEAKHLHSKSETLHQLETFYALILLSETKLSAVE